MSGRCARVHFAWPGIGRMIVDAINNGLLVQGTIMTSPDLRLGEPDN